ncbi:MAG: tetratricopeptide repeat protein [Terriglobia bacterium]
MFAVLCAARAAGVVRATAGADPVTAYVDDYLAKLDPGIVAPVRAYLEEKLPGGKANDLNTYVSLGLVLEPPPSLDWIFPRQNLPPDVWPLQDFPARLKSFYAQARLDELWHRVLPAYERAMAERQSGVAQELLETRGYLRLLGEKPGGPSYTIYFEWLVRPSLTSARNYSQHHYLVVHPQHADFLDAVRHQYLHFLLDSIVARNAEAMGSWFRLEPLLESARALPPAFRDDLLLLATESLIQGVELRLRRLEPDAVAGKLDELERTGYFFVRHFYHALEIYEQEEPSMRHYFPELLRGFDAAQEQARLEKLEFAAPAPVRPPELAAAPAPPPSLLREGKTLLAAGDYDAARERFERVLQDVNPNEADALYGLAIVASAEMDRERARSYFLRTLETAREPLILGWTHVYLGRIYDLEGKREQALEHYHAALALQTRLAKIEQAARRGLEQPFGQ